MKSYIVKPIITEKTIQEANSKNRYAFLVTNDANKIVVKKEIAEKFNVKVTAVSVANYLGKSVKFGKKRVSGLRSAYKKATVTLEKGSKIPLFELK